MTDPVQTAGYWDNAVDGYVAVAEPFTARFCEDAVALAGIERGTTLLDIATGPGALAIAAAQAGAIVTAIDFSPAMVARLHERVGALPVTARVGDGQALDLPDAAFDRVCSVFGIPLFPDWRRGLKEAARVLRPGGRLVIAVTDNRDGFGPNRLLSDARAALYPDRPAHGVVEGMAILADRARLIGEVAAAGFTAIVVHDRTHDFLIDPAMLTADNPALTGHPLIADLSDGERQRVIERVIAENLPRAGPAGLAVPGTARIVVATKP